jgi:hypothetical protein
MPGNPQKQQQAHQSAADVRRAKSKQARSARLKARKYKVAEVMNMDVSAIMASYSIKEVAMKVSGQSASDIASADRSAANNALIAAAADKQAQRNLEELHRAADNALATADTISAINEANAAGLAAQKGSIQSNAQKFINAAVDAVSAAAASQDAAAAAGVADASRSFAKYSATMTEIQAAEAAGDHAKVAALRAQLAADAVAKEAALRAAAEETKEALEKINGVFDSINTELANLYKNFKDIDTSLLKAAMIKFLDDVMKQFNLCEGEKTYEIYWCQKHVVYCEKQLDESGKPTKVCFNGVRGVSYSDPNKEIKGGSWPAICCENEKDDWQTGWSKAETTKEPNYRIMVWPASVCERFPEVGLNFGGIALDDNNSQPPRRKPGKDGAIVWKGDVFEKLASKNNGPMKLYFDSSQKSKDTRMKIMKEKYENYYELDEGTNDFIDFEVLRDAKIKAIEERLEAAQKKEGASLSTQSFEDEIDEAGSEWDEMNNNLQFAIAELVIAVAQDEARKRAASDYCAKQKLKGGGGK